MNRRASLEPAYVPGSTYRLQLNLRFTFTQAAAVVAYLDDLGITDCYTSPFLMAHPGSMHGYDVTDHTRFNPEIGSEEQFTEFAERLQATRYGPGGRRRAQSHVHHASFESVVVGRAGERAELGLFPPFRY